MLHRSVKPANILFTNPADGEQQILLTDFGIARQLGDPDGSAPDLTGEMVAYAAPEQLTASDIDGRADQYSLAATAYFLLTGAPPFQQSNPVAVISQHLTAPPPSLRDRRPELARLDDVFARALAKNPRDRFSSCRAFADALSHSAGAWTGDRSPEAYLTVVDYPEDDDALDTQPAAAGLASAAAPSTFFPAWAKTVRRLAQHHAAPREPVAVDRSTTPAQTRRSRWPWVIGLGTAAASLCVAMVAVGVIIGRGNDTGSTHAAGPLTAIRSSAPKAAPPTSSHDFPGAGEALDGSYRIDVNREQQTYNSTPDPQPPNVSTWWAFRTACTPKSCVATGALLDEHGKLSPGGEKPVVLDFRNGAWQSRPETMLFACLGPDGAPAKQTTTQVIWLQQSHGALRGTMTVTVESNECSQQGATIEIPAVAARVAEVPPGVEVPSPPSTTPPALAPTTPPR
jgi:serine/threonine-protein kinase